MTEKFEHPALDFRVEILKFTNPRLASRISSRSATAVGSPTPEMRKSSTQWYSELFVAQCACSESQTSPAIIHHPHSCRPNPSNRGLGF